MSGEKATVADAATKGASQRQRSTIGFPYTDLGSAVELADAIHGHAGMGDCDDDQLGAWTDQSSKSSTFRVQVYAARMFGILEGEGSRHKLSELGRSIVDPNQVRESKARAFMNIPLFKAVYDKYRGGVLPPSAALERDMVALGVGEKQKGRARQVFERSAEQAGFFEHGKNRLVMPAVAIKGDAPLHSHEEKVELKKGGGSGGEGGERRLHPFIQGLLDTIPDIPDPREKPEWAVPERAKWLQTAANIFDLIYSGEGGIKIEAAMAQRSPRPGEH